jgi:hypothetical protein
VAILKIYLVLKLLNMVVDDTKIGDHRQPHRKLRLEKIVEAVLQRNDAAELSSSTPGKNR